MPRQYPQQFRERGIFAWLKSRCLNMKQSSRYSLVCRDLEELLAERGIDVDHVTLYRWVQRFTPELIDAARPRRHGRR